MEALVPLVPLVPSVFIYNALELLPAQKAPALFGEELHTGVAGVLRDVRCVRGNQHVRQRPQRRFLGQWLYSEHVQRGTRHVARLQRPYERLLVQQRAASDVDQHQSLLGGLEVLLAYHPRSLLCQSHADHKVVALGHEGAQLVRAVDMVNVAVAAAVVWVSPQSEDAHAVHLGQARARLADAAVPYYSHRCTPQLLDWKLLPCVCALLPVQAWQVFGEVGA
mmetsp:Transcript_27615/g.61882  ORF Transcript_27615/g.61882 Transcript_27615/m.61882 type:complete len:222 (-) Transcript_27615:514-1179(-)